tara:strand:+ start:725 stop:934 length:210 start_codon:yes stop_codon:yes gene_type:complete
MLAYCVASILYFIITRFISTPFRDSLTDEQKIIKTKSSRIRGGIFVGGLFVSIAALIKWKPFNECKKTN